MIPSHEVGDMSNLLCIFIQLRLNFHFYLNCKLNSVYYETNRAHFYNF